MILLTGSFELYLEASCDQRLPNFLLFFSAILFGRGFLKFVYNFLPCCLLWKWCFFFNTSLILHPIHEGYPYPCLESGEYNISIFFFTPSIIPECAYHFSDFSPLRCFSPSGGPIISATILFLAVVVGIPHHWTVVAIGIGNMSFVGSCNYIHGICEDKVEGTG